MSNKTALGTLEQQITVMSKFPDQNPNPVMKVSRAGELLYANRGAKALMDQWQKDCGQSLPPELVDRVTSVEAQTIELGAGHSTFFLDLVPVPEFGFVNVYGTDITAVRAITKFPDQNPNPVLKTDILGHLQYVNKAGGPIVETWGLSIGELVPGEVVSQADRDTADPLELVVGTKTYSFHVVTVPEFECLNIYATDISAAKENELILGKVAKYFSSQVYESIFTGDLEVKIQTERKRLTVFFSDIKGFSEITEQLEPEVLTELITEYLSAMTDIAVKHGGTVDKYIGDAIMIFFGAPQTRGAKEDALACVRMAMEMKVSLRKVRALWRDRGLTQSLDVRVGIHSDTCTVGNFGSRDRLVYTTIGNGVNLASRLESNARPNQILISEDTYLLIRNTIRCEKLEKILVKSIKQPVQTYEVDGEASDESALRRVEKHMDGFSLYIDPDATDHLSEKRDALQRALRLIDRLD
ncbi:MAG: adenylate/guanylate cyclase domain-containing protein [Myxococcota bacterium]|nr:adenylate/guanylate cyclase domain-containing protein [Myxococcota bacterium]